MKLIQIVQQAVLMTPPQSDKRYQHHEARRLIRIVPTPKMYQFTIILEANELNRKT